MFAQFQLDLRESVYLTAGLRGDDNSNFGDELGTPLLPRVGLSVVREVGGATIKARVAYGEAFRAPQFGASTGVVTSTGITLSNPSLAPEQREVLLLVALEDLSYADVSRAIGIPMGTVMSRLSRGRERLRIPGHFVVRVAEAEVVP